MLVVMTCLSIGAFACSDDGTEGGKDLAVPDTATIDVSSSPDQAVPDQAPVTADSGGESVPACPIEKNLASYVPCDCFGTIVTDVTTIIPGCTKTIKCCPGAKAPVCE